MIDATVDASGAVVVSNLSFSWGEGVNLQTAQWTIVGQPVGLWSWQLIDLGAQAEETLPGVKVGMANNSSVLDVHLGHTPSELSLQMIASAIARVIENVTGDGCAFEPDF